MKAIRLSILAGTLVLSHALRADHVIFDDCIIDGSMSVGLDSVNNENFGFDTLRLKENNLRFHFDDTSVAASFPRNDWRIIANDSANGGLSYLGFEDSTAGRIPFRVEAGAPLHALYVEDSGDVGLGTNNPVVELHLADGDTPTVRLEQNGTSGFTAQTWDMAANETNFFIRDVTNGSKLPFRIRPNAPTSSIDIQANGRVEFKGAGISGGSSGDLKVIKSMTIGSTVGEVRLSLPEGVPGEFPAIRVGEAFISSGPGLAYLSNNNWLNGLGISANNKNRPGGLLQIADSSLKFFATSAGVGVPSFTETFNLGPTGNLTTAGTINGVSDRNKKADIVEVDTHSVLERLSRMPISTWRYKWEEDITHMGPMAQDFWKEFKLGQGDKTLSPFDTAAVALASAQELNKLMLEKEKRIDDLEKRNGELEQRLQRIEEALLRNENVEVK